MKKWPSRQKKIYLNRGRRKYCKAVVFKYRKDMQENIRTIRPDMKLIRYTSGIHFGYSKGNASKKRIEVLSETGTIFLWVKDCGVGIVAHELMHAILWAHKHKWNKKQYPIIIKNMEEEEHILYNLTYAVIQFYNWYWKIIDNGF